MLWNYNRKENHSLELWNLPLTPNSDFSYIRTPGSVFCEFGFNISFWKRGGWGKKKKKNHHLSLKKLKIEASKGHYWRKTFFGLCTTLPRSWARCCLFCIKSTMVLTSIKVVIFNISFLGSVKRFREDAADCEKRGMKYLYMNSVLSRCFT